MSASRLFEPAQEYSVTVKDENTKFKQVVSIKREHVALYSSSLDSRRTEIEDGLLWQVVAAPAASEQKSEGGAQEWDVSAQLGLVRIDDVDLKMMRRALKRLREFTVELLQFTNAARADAFAASLDKFVAEHFESEDAFKAKGRYEIYYGNEADVNVPVIAFFPTAEPTQPRFWFFKDALVSSA